MLFVYREEYYVNFQKPTEPDANASEFDPTNVAFREWQSSMERVHGVAEVVVAKSRHGSTGTIPVKFDAKITRFSDLVGFELCGAGYGVALTDELGAPSTVRPERSRRS